MKNIHFALFIFFLILFSHCSPKLKIGSKEHVDLTHKLIFEKKNWMFFEKNNKTLHIHPVLKYRPTLSQKMTGAGTGKKTEHPLLFNSYPESMKLEFPKEHQDLCAYLPDSINLTKNLHPGIYYSPLLPTKKKNIFFIQKYWQADAEEPDMIVRFFYETLEFYELKSDKLYFLEKVQGEEYLGVVIPKK